MYIIQASKREYAAVCIGENNVNLSSIDLASNKKTSHIYFTLNPLECSLHAYQENPQEQVHRDVITDSISLSEMIVYK